MTKSQTNYKLYNCNEHNKSCKFICYTCSLLLCSKCIMNHLNHQCDHIDIIKDSLVDISVYFKNKENENKKDLAVSDNSLQIKYNTSNFNNIIVGNSNDNNNNNNNDSNIKENTENKYRTRIETIWLIIKDSIDSLEELKSKEVEISDHFKQLHEYLIIEEHRLKKPIIDELDMLRQQISNRMTELQSFIELIQISLQINKNSKDNNSNENGDDGEDNNEDIENNQHQQRDDTLDKYQLDSIVKSIKESVGLCSFVQNNENTLFYHGVKEKDSTDILLLDYLMEYNKRYKPTESNLEDHIYKPKNKYQICIEDIELQLFKDTIAQSIRIVSQDNSQIDEYSNISTEIIRKPKSTCLFIVRYDSQISLVDLNNFSYTIDTRSFRHDFIFTKSLVNVGEYIYMIVKFASVFETRYHLFRFCIRSKVLENQSEFNTIDVGEGMSLAYDGADHIYFINGFNENLSMFLHRIDRFDIKQKRFEVFYKLNCGVCNHILSFFYKGLLYSIPYSEKKIYIFDPLMKSTAEYINEQLLEINSMACHDGNGNVYLHSNNQAFIKFNIVSKQIDRLTPNMKIIGLFTIVSLVYYKSTTTDESFIYLISGKDFGSYIYSVKNDNWTSFQEINQLDCTVKGSTLFSIY